MSDEQADLRVFFICSGLGRVGRGFETYAVETAAALRTAPGFKVDLFGGRGCGKYGGRFVPSFSRDGTLAKWVGAVLRRVPYEIELLSFALCLMPYILLKRPSVIVCSEGSTAALLWALRNPFGFGYRILVCNHAPIGPPFHRVDFVQHVVAETYERSLRMNFPPERQSLVRPIFSVPDQPVRLSGSKREITRRSLKLPETRPIVICVGAVQREHKRADYVIREFSRVAVSACEERPFLLLLGQTSRDTSVVRAIAHSEVGEGNYEIRTVPPEVVQSYLAVSDIFVLGSLYEAFGRVLVEACIAGLPCLVHDSINSRNVLGSHALYADLSMEGNLTKLLFECISRCPDPVEETRRYQYAVDQFSWKALLPYYVEMIRRTSAVAPSPKHW